MKRIINNNNLQWAAAPATTEESCCDMNTVDHREHKNSHREHLRPFTLITLRTFTDYPEVTFSMQDFYSNRVFCFVVLFWVLFVLLLQYSWILPHPQPFTMYMLCLSVSLSLSLCLSVCLSLRNAVNDGRKSGGAVSRLIGCFPQDLPYKESTGRDREEERRRRRERGRRPGPCLGWRDGWRDGWRRWRVDKLRRCSSHSHFCPAPPHVPAGLALPR